MEKKEYLVLYKNREINFTLERKKVKNINLRIKPDKKIYISANNQVPVKYIKSFVVEKGDWILEKLDSFDKIKLREEKVRRYKDGETFLFLGKKYKLKIFEKEKEGVFIREDFLELHIKDKKNFKRREKLINNWYESKIDEVFEKSLEDMYNLIKKYGVKKPSMKKRRMKARWGTCYPNRNLIIINKYLIKTKKKYIDYVILHELIHFLYRGHGKDFYGVFLEMMPDLWERKKGMEKLAWEILG